jgi:hypothetical protein
MEERDAQRTIDATRNRIRFKFTRQGLLFFQKFLAHPEIKSAYGHGAARQQKRTSAGTSGAKYRALFAPICRSLIFAINKSTLLLIV